MESSGIDVRRFKFIDEAGSNLAMTRSRGRAAPGERVFDTAPQNARRKCFDAGGFIN